MDYVLPKWSLRDGNGHLKHPSFIVIPCTPYSNRSYLETWCYGGLQEALCPFLGTHLGWFLGPATRHYGEFAGYFCMHLYTYRRRSGPTRVILRGLEFPEHASTPTTIVDSV